MKQGKREIALSVHDLIDFLLRQGDIDDRVYNSETMNRGSLLHSKFQQAQGSNYLSEYFLSDTISVEEGTIYLQGRADGIIAEEIPIIDEIKTTVQDLEEFASIQREWHEGQALCYAYMYIHKFDLPKAKIRLTYIAQQDEKSTLVEEAEWDRATIEEKVQGYAKNYFRFLLLRDIHVLSRDVSIGSLSFPYDEYRLGQKELAKYVYASAKKGEIFFAEAPTGIGKTMSTLYPAVKSFNAETLDRIFYLTAKTTGCVSAYKAIGELREKGLDAWDIWLLSKEKRCPHYGCGCNPDECPMAVGYFQKCREAIEECLNSPERFDPGFVQRIAEEKQMCPFEFQLDLSSYCDIIICDYNYVFDPLVHLERFFGEEVDPSKFFLLIDEAHNLLDRAREMYSSRLDLTMIHQALAHLPKKGASVYKRRVEELEDDIIDIVEPGFNILEAPPESIQKTISKWRAAEMAKQKKGKKPPKLPIEYRDLSREANRFYRLAQEHYSPAFRCYSDDEGTKSVCLYCVDPSEKIAKALKRVRGAVLFSGTLSPISYQMDALLGNVDYPYILLSSPFPKKNMELMVAPKVSVRYKDREKTLPEVAEYINAFISGKKGNYFVFFPSYAYMEALTPLLKVEDGDIYAQTRGMNNAERMEFLDLFPQNPSKTNVGLLVLGGAFSEGIDLVDDRLIGVAVIGVGLPLINKESDLIRDYFDAKEGKGFAYAYKDPGMNKVLQALGRLIRSESDRGVALLLDDRYGQHGYRDILNRLYPQHKIVTSSEDVKRILTAFQSE